ncbi:class I SAM-dependent methyltransferase [Phaeobacter marinintestinus]|uniref:class I SAM-dependent methyltransferase n=1 Tax=Falsiphaeobacter marinintestinus TaxID=1492905 RepID=UPI0011B7CDDE|nr:class I SAM-dependent methyltransferase [Phaeobacter marinintestinus]
MTETNSGASRDAIEFHYDMPADFFALWLGKSMTYTAARFTRSDMTLDEAQADKINYHLDAAGVEKGHRMLDIGCGWGTLLKSAVELRGAGSAHGLTLSPLQQKYISSLGLPNVSAALESYEHHHPEEPYDSIVSVGAFEHFVKPGMTREERLDVYSELFRRCAEWLTRDGRLSLQTMTWGDAGQVERDMNRIHEIFPESDLPEIAEVVEAAHPHLELMSMENRPEDYGTTLAEWAKGLRANREQAIDIVGEERFKFYLDSCVGGSLLYRRRRFYLCRFVFRRRGR